MSCFDPTLQSPLADAGACDHLSATGQEGMRTTVKVQTSIHACTYQLTHAFPQSDNGRGDRAKGVAPPCSCFSGDASFLLAAAHAALPCCSRVGGPATRPRSPHPCFLVSLYPCSFPYAHANPADLCDEGPWAPLW